MVFSIDAEDSPFRRLFSTSAPSGYPHLFMVCKPLIPPFRFMMAPTFLCNTFGSRTRSLPPSCPEIGSVQMPWSPSLRRSLAIFSETAGARPPPLFLTWLGPSPGFAITCVRQLHSCSPLRFSVGFPRDELLPRANSRNHFIHQHSKDHFHPVLVLPAFSGDLFLSA